MSADDFFERRPAVNPADTRVARAVLETVRELHARHPGTHVCGDYSSDPLMVIVRAVDADGVTVDEEWIAKP
jgi:hypothetical protein